MDEASKRRSLAREELQRTRGNVVLVTDVRIKEIPGAAHHISHTELLQVLQGE